MCVGGSAWAFCGHPLVLGTYSYPLREKNTEHGEEHKMETEKRKEIADF